MYHLGGRLAESQPMIFALKLSEKPHERAKRRVIRRVIAA